MKKSIILVLWGGGALCNMMNMVSAFDVENFNAKTGAVYKKIYSHAKEDEGAVGDAYFDCFLYVEADDAYVGLENHLKKAFDLSKNDEKFAAVAVEIGRIQDKVKPVTQYWPLKALNSFSSETTLKALSSTLDNAAAALKKGKKNPKAVEICAELAEVQKALVASIKILDRIKRNGDGDYGWITNPCFKILEWALNDTTAILGEKPKKEWKTLFKKD
ncbi:MAG: hypothetical protein LBC04_01005 [Holosporaceae bacterium]|jgi:hypothetical protein|nr:hypothetical protein [Holosporaceae bacterium]